MPKRTSVVLKLLNGSAQRNPARLRDDRAITPKGRLEATPPFVALTPEQQAVFDWYLKSALPNVHTVTDAALLTDLAICEVRLLKAREKIEEFGMGMRSPGGGMPRLQLYFHAERKLVAEKTRLLSELSMTPQGRLKAAPAMGGSPRDETSWDSIDL